MWWVLVTDKRHPAITIPLDFLTKESAEGWIRTHRRKDCRYELVYDYRGV